MLSASRVPALSDAEHLRQFEDQSLPRHRWNHRAHLKVGYLYLTRFPFDEAVSRMRAGIKAYNAAHGIPDSPSTGYHKTMTLAWLHLIHTTINEFGPAASADEFLAPDLAPLPRPLKAETR